MGVRIFWPRLCCRCEIEKTRLTQDLSDPKHDANWPASCEGQGSHPMECPSAPKSAADSLLIVSQEGRRMRSKGVSLACLLVNVLQVLYHPFLLFGMPEECWHPLVEIVLGKVILCRQAVHVRLTV